MIVKIIELSLFFVIVSANNGGDYCNVACGVPPHTVCERKEQVCGGGPLCGPEFEAIEMTDELRQHMLDVHNTLRNTVASGLEKPQPSASNMKALSYNKELEFIAQCWANTCHGKPLKHDVCRNTVQYPYVGQNLASFGSTSSSIDLLAFTKKRIEQWYREVDYFDESNVDAFKSGKGREGKDVGHYTQVVWANTVEVGCAISSYTKVENGRKWYNKILACNYGPGGNVLGTPVYIRGEPASNCSPGEKSNKNFKGLCGEDRPLTETATYMNDLFKVFI